MGFAVLKQHSEKLKHGGFSGYLGQSFTGHETDPQGDNHIEKDTKTSQQHERKAHQSVLHQFFI